MQKQHVTVVYKNLKKNIAHKRKQMEFAFHSTAALHLYTVSVHLPCTLQQNSRMHSHWSFRCLMSRIAYFAGCGSMPVNANCKKSRISDICHHTQWIKVLNEVSGQQSDNSFFWGATRNQCAAVADYRRRAILNEAYDKGRCSSDGSLHNLRSQPSATHAHRHTDCCSEPRILAINTQTRRITHKKTDRIWQPDKSDTQCV